MSVDPKAGIAGKVCICLWTSHCSLPSFCSSSCSLPHPVLHRTLTRDY